MKFSAPKLVFSALLAGVAGCFSFETSSMGSGAVPDADGDVPVEHVVVANNGWYLFNAWPLACGSAQTEHDDSWAFFRNDVDMDLLHTRLTRHARARGCQIRNLAVFNDEQVLLSIPGSSLPLPIPYVITYRELQLSGVLVKHPTASEAAR